MKYIFSILFCLILQSGFSQIFKTVGISYTNGTPTYTPAKAGSWLALDTVTWKYYTYNGSTWLSDGYRIQTISGCSAPGYTPTKFQSLLVVNACTEMQGGPELYFYNGSAWLCLNCDSGSGIDTLSSYTALRAYTGTSLAVYVQTFTYTFNSVSYTTLGGLFRQVPTGTENGGTLIAAANGVKWARDWDGINIQPEWWECGGYDTDGTGSPTRLTTNGVYNNRDRLQAAVNIGAGKTIVLGASVRSYDIDIAISAASDCNIDGNGVILRRANAPFSALTSTFSGTSCSVTDASGFRVGMYLVALDILNSKARSPFYSGYGAEENSRTTGNPAKPFITAISGNTITYNSSPPASIPTGGILMQTDDILVMVNGTQQETYIKDVVFDGNWTNAGATYRFTNDYAHTHSIYTSTASTKRTVIDNCEFKRVPGENIITCNTGIYNCIADSLFGSFSHVSRSTVKQNLIVEISGNTITNTGLATVGVNGHGEGAITFSANPNNYNIHHNIFYTGKHFVFGFIDKQGDGANETLNAVFDHNTCTNYTGILVGYYSAGSTLDKRLKGVQITNNSFTRCGDLFISTNAGAYTKGGHFFGVDISDNNFVDSRVIVEHADGTKINNNNLLFSSEFGHTAFFGRQATFTGFNTTINTIYQAAVYVTGSRVNIEGNRIEAFKVYNDTIRHGIFTDVHALGALKDSLGTNTDFNYQNNFNISDNTVTGFARGISTMSGNFGAPASVRESIGVEINRNYIHNSKTIAASGDSWGLTVCPGCSAKSNTIIRENASTIPLYLIGPTYDLSDTVSGLHSRVRGAFAQGNRVYGASSGNDIYVGNVNIWNANNICEGNFFEVGIFNHGGTKNYVAGNVAMTTTNLPKLTNRKVPPYNFYMLNKSVY